MTAAIILKILLSINGDQEPSATREALLRPIALAIQQASSGDRDKAAYLIALGAVESNFMRYVIEGRCQEGRYKCDIDPKTGKPRALGPWQLWEAACSRAHKAGSASFEIQTECVLSLAAFHARKCQASGPRNWSNSFAGHAGHSCKGSDPRWQKREALRLKYKERL